MTRYEAQLRRTLERAGFDVLGFVRNKHYKITVRRGDREFFVVTSATPSDHRALQNVVSSANRALLTNNIRR